MRVAVVIPWRSGGCEHRRDALAWVRDRWLSYGPRVVEVIVAPDPFPEGPWRKGVAIADGVRRSSTELVIVADADVWSDGVDEALEIAAAHGWAMPHVWVERLTPASTALALDGMDLATAARHSLERRYEQTAAGGMVVLRRDVALAVPVDPRFEGWGHEDEAWRYALEVLVGPRERVRSTLYHLWHPPAKKQAGRFLRNQALKLRYGEARRRGAAAMRPLVAEAVRSLSDYGIGAPNAQLEQP